MVGATSKEALIIGPDVLGRDEKKIFPVTKSFVKLCGSLRARNVSYFFFFLISSVTAKP